MTIYCREVTCNKLEYDFYKNEKEYIIEENKPRMENNAKLLAALIYLNYVYSNGKAICNEHIYKILHDSVNYVNEEKEKIKQHAFIYLRVDYKLQLNN